MRSFVRFLRYEDGGSATLWALFWLMGFVALLGMGLDTTAAMNTKAKLQTVADMASHAATMDIFPVANDAIATALDYAEENAPNQAGIVGPGDVTVGYWDSDAREFRTDEDVPYLNAVRVVAARNTARDNALATMLLKVVGFDNWDIAAASTATYYNDMSLTDRCRLNGFVAGGSMELTSNNKIVGAFCMHGQGGLKINQNNLITCGVQLSTVDSSGWQTGQAPSGMPPIECNTDYASLSNDEMIEQSVVYTSVPSRSELEYENVKEMLDAYVAGEPLNDPFNAIPPYITGTTTIDVTAFNLQAKLGLLLPGTLYVVDCGGTGKRLKPDGIIRNVGIYTDCVVEVQKNKLVSMVNPSKTVDNQGESGCDPDTSNCDGVTWESEIPYDYSCAEAVAAGFEPYATFLDTASGETYRDGVTVDEETQLCGIEPGATGVWDNVFLFTTAYEDGDRSHDAVSFPNNMQIGRLDGCEEGGGVRLYAGGSISTPSGTMMHGSQLVVLGDAKLAAKASGTQGTTVDAGGSIQFSAQGTLGGCAGQEDALASDTVITVRPVAIVN